LEYPVVHSAGECWDRLAKWPDGKAFGEFELIFGDAPPGSDNERDHWRKLIGKKLVECENARPFAQRLVGWVTDNLSSIKGSVVLILLPPFALLLLGCCVGWVAKGFQPRP
jgi:hypothetical protein